MPKLMIIEESTLSSIPVAACLEAEKIAAWVQVERGTGQDPTGQGSCCGPRAGDALRELGFAGRCWGCKASGQSLCG